MYGYDAQDGFYLRTSIALKDMRWDDSRGLYISGFFYVVSNSTVVVIDMTTFQVLKTINYDN